MMRRGLLLFIVTTSLSARAWSAEPATGDVTSLHHKVMCGYQGWFRCPGDAAGQGWRHWSRDGRRITPRSLTFEMWPEMSEYGDDEKYPALGFTNADGQTAQLFSSVHPKTVQRHLEWMKQHGIDGVFLQRFLVEVGEPSLNQVLANVRKSANDTGRAFAICYDMSGMKPERLYDTLVGDWKRLVEEQQITSDPCYLHHNGKPVLFVWGFYSDRFGPELADKIVDFFKNDPEHGVVLIGGCQWWWRTEKDTRWQQVFRRFDVISPWNVGNSTMIDGQKHAATGSWKEDLAACHKSGMRYLPVIYPGFGWTNLQGSQAAKNDLPRLKGEFFWRQFSVAKELGIDMAYVAMFDEVDEGTAIFKVSNSPPTPGRFVTYEGLPTDWYLRLTGEGTKLIRGERENSKTIPIQP